MSAHRNTHMQNKTPKVVFASFSVTIYLFLCVINHSKVKHSILVSYCAVVLYCTVLYCIVLCCIVLYCTVFYCIVLYWPSIFVPSNSSSSSSCANNSGAIYAGVPLCVYMSEWVSESLQRSKKRKRELIIIIHTYIYTYIPYIYIHTLRNDSSRTISRIKSYHESRSDRRDKHTHTHKCTKEGDLV